MNELIYREEWVIQTRPQQQLPNEIWWSDIGPKLTGPMGTDVTWARVYGIDEKECRAIAQYICGAINASQRCGSIDPGK